MRQGLLFVPLAILAFVVGTSLSNAATGGPDGGGYTFIDNGSAGGPVFAFEDITGTGTLSTVTDEDDAVQLAVPFGFSFTLYGTPYTSAGLSTNGFLRFDSSTDDECCDDRGPIPSPFISSPAIFGWWNDWDPSKEGDPEGEGCGDLLYQTKGSAPARRFIVEWDSCHNDEPTKDVHCKATFEMILFETTNHILFQYLDTIYSPQGGPTECDGEPGPNTNDHGAHASVGIQRDSGVGLAYSINGSRLLTDGLAVCYRPSVAGSPCGAPAPTPTSTPTSTSVPTVIPTPRPPVGGAVAAVAAAGAQARDNRATVAAGGAFPAATVTIVAPRTGTGITPPNTGDAGLTSQASTGFRARLSFFIVLGAAAVALSLRLRRVR